MSVTALLADEMLLRSSLSLTVIGLCAPIGNGCFGVAALRSIHWRGIGLLCSQNNRLCTPQLLNHHLHCSSHSLCCVRVCVGPGTCQSGPAGTVAELRASESEHGNLLCRRIVLFVWVFSQERTGLPEACWVDLLPGGRVCRESSL